MSYVPPIPAEDEDAVMRRQAEAIDQNRRLTEQLGLAGDAVAKAEEAMREARRLMSFPFSTSVSWREHNDDD